MHSFCSILYFIIHIAVFDIATSQYSTITYQDAVMVSFIAVEVMKSTVSFGANFGLVRFHDETRENALPTVSTGTTGIRIGVIF